MSNIDLVILGILLKKDMNAHEITIFVEKNSVDKFLKISTPAIYKASKRLYKSGKLNGRIIRDGELPEKTVYSINEEGLKYFYELMDHFSRNINPFFFEFNSFIWNLDNLKKSDANKMLLNLKKSILYLKEGISLHEKEISEHMPFTAKMILKQYVMIINVLSEWIELVIAGYQKK
ncbi:MAG: PadR family transcriptional regulator [Spirochaetes bacterium]|nr:PadR family transcriptional regulator [Spirochaetota bacterium]